MKQPHLIRFFNWVSYRATKTGRGSKKSNVNANPAEMLVFTKKNTDFDSAKAIIANALGVHADDISICEVVNLVTCDDNIIQFPA
jgi:hypothetical protein